LVHEGAEFCEWKSELFSVHWTPAVVPAIRDWTPQVLDALFGVVQDATANPKVRTKAALKIAEFLPPKAGKKACFWWLSPVTLDTPKSRARARVHRERDASQ